MKRLLLFIFLVFLPGCLAKNDDRAIITGLVGKAQQAINLNDGNAYLELISADSPARGKEAEFAINLDEKKIIKKINLEIKNLEINGNFANADLVMKEDSASKECRLVFRRERVSWKIFEDNCF